jgi:hypothetical protein
MAKIKKNSAVPRALGVRGIALFPYIFIKDEGDDVIVNHESIHIEQQKELWVLPFYLLYVLFWLRGMRRLGDSRMAYYDIPFEKEAYSNAEDLSYLKNRERHAWKKYV